MLILTCWVHFSVTWETAVVYSVALYIPMCEVPGRSEYSRTRTTFKTSEWDWPTMKSHE